ncbi:unnamed protein product [Pleuronectes platessa]|uniref:Uncharacterized protein n=1 Tax=Pleuronectes platessa TaxID=8262 RepID=A0A9N7Z721_PLEPL|nr:unnamed protein product [Pleuronectes platessa]
MLLDTYEHPGGSGCVRRIVHIRAAAGTSWRARTRGGVCQSGASASNTSEPRTDPGKHAQSEQHLDRARHMRLSTLGKETCSHIRRETPSATTRKYQTCLIR